MEMMLQTQNLCKYFRKQKAVNNVSLNIEKGQIYGLLGPNGVNQLVQDAIRNQQSQRYDQYSGESPG